MALPSRRTPMQAFDRPTVGCCASAPALVCDSHHDASADMRAALVATASALNFMSQNGSAKAPRKLAHALQDRR